MNYVYLMIGSNGLFKIGVTNNLSRRRATIKQGNAAHCEFLSYYNYTGKSIKDYEQKLHDRFESKRVHNEWFALTREDLLSITSREKVKELINNIPEELFELGKLQLKYKREINKFLDNQVRPQIGPY